MTRLRPRTARTAVAGLVVAAALALTGCSATNPITTIADYDASDGLGASVGDIRAQNMLVIAESEGAAGVLTGALANRSSEDEEVTLGVGDGEPVSVSVPAGGSVLLGVSDAPAGYVTTDVPVAAVDAAPGGLTTLRITTARGGALELQVPVLDGALPEYAAVLDGITTAPTAGPTPTTDPTAETTQEASEVEEDDAEQGD